MRSFLKLSSSSPIPALYFLLGQLPIEAKLHLDFLSLFFTIWNNQHTTIHKVVMYILQMSDNSSITWAAHLRTLCLKYRLPDPLKLLKNEQAWSKQRWSELTKTMITVYHETEQRLKARRNSKMNYLNVQLQGLSGKPHPALLNISNTQDIPKLRQHLKMLTGDYLTAERLALDTGSNPKCKLCLAPTENIDHILTKCRATADIKQRMLPELLNSVAIAQPDCIILNLPTQAQYLTQFILDCTSPNLPGNCRIAAHNPLVGTIFHVSRHWCFAASQSRGRLLKQLNKFKHSAT